MTTNTDDNTTTVKLDSHIDVEGTGLHIWVGLTDPDTGDTKGRKPMPYVIIDTSDVDHEYQYDDRTKRRGAPYYVVADDDDMSAQVIGHDEKVASTHYTGAGRMAKAEAQKWADSLNKDAIGLGMPCIMVDVNDGPVYEDQGDGPIMPEYVKETWGGDLVRLLAAAGCETVDDLVGKIERADQMIENVSRVLNASTGDVSHRARQAVELMDEQNIILSEGDAR